MATVGCEKRSHPTCAGNMLIALPEPFYCWLVLYLRGTLAPGKGCIRFTWLRHRAASNGPHWIHRGFLSRSGNRRNSLGRSRNLETNSGWKCKGVLSLHRKMLYATMQQDFVIQDVAEWSQYESDPVLIRLLPSEAFDIKVKQRAWPNIASRLHWLWNMVKLMGCELASHSLLRLWLPCHSATHRILRFRADLCVVGWSLAMRYLGRTLNMFFVTWRLQRFHFLKIWMLRRSWWPVGHTLDH